MTYHTLSYVDHWMTWWAVQFEGKGSYLIYLMRAVFRLCESIRRGFFSYGLPRGRTVKYSCGCAVRCFGFCANPNHYGFT